MPHNRAERQQVIKDSYAFVVYGGEYGLHTALFITADIILTGGNLTYEFLKEEVKDFGIDLATAMATANPPVNPATEELYFGKFIFQTWESPFLPVSNKRVYGPNKFVPYVAARRKHEPPLPEAETGHLPSASPAMTFNEKLANAFGHIKNARLVATASAVEDQNGHVNWALGQDVSVVKGEIKTDLQTALAYLTNPILLAATSIFAYVKAGRLVMQDPPITPAQESLEGHSNWAIQQTLPVIKEEANAQAAKLKELAVIT